jgi:hypothetical protein
MIEDRGGRGGGKRLSREAWMNEEWGGRGGGKRANWEAWMIEERGGRGHARYRRRQKSREVGKRAARYSWRQEKSSREAGG